jgi:Tfp pilus assembly protein PilF
MLEHDPNYAGAHYALALVARHGGDTRTAQTEAAAAARLWSMADSDLPELKVIRDLR